MTWLCGVPDPAVPDEFSYLLAADTFCPRPVDRIPPIRCGCTSSPCTSSSNPPTRRSTRRPRAWRSLAGQATLGLPIAGVWLSAGLACARADVDARRLDAGALGAGRRAARRHAPPDDHLEPELLGGLVALFGGASCGAFGRLVRRRPRARHAVVLGGLGLGVLANTRPYEGLILSVPLLIAPAVWVLRRLRPAGPPADGRRIPAPLGGVLLLVAAGMLWYNHRTTGDPLTMPYMVHQRSYMPIPLVVFRGPAAADLPTRPAREGLGHRRPCARSRVWRRWSTSGHGTGPPVLGAIPILRRARGPPTARAEPLVSPRGSHAGLLLHRRSEPESVDVGLTTWRLQSAWRCWSPCAPCGARASGGLAASGSAGRSSRPPGPSWPHPSHAEAGCARRWVTGGGRTRAPRSPTAWP